MTMTQLIIEVPETAFAAFKQTPAEFVRPGNENDSSC